MHRTLIILFLLFIGLNPAIVSCSPAKGELNPHAFKATMNDAREKILIDVRTEEEYLEGHIKGALNFDWNGADFAASISKLDKGKPLFVYCKSGRRSDAAAKAMREMGFTNIYTLQGGIDGWSSSGMKVEHEDERQQQGISMAQYHEMLNTDKLVLVDFYTTWCTPCKRMEPFLKEIQADYAATLELQKLNTDKNTLIARELNIATLPTLLLYKNEKIVWSHIGFIDKVELIKKILIFN